MNIRCLFAALLASMAVTAGGIAVAHVKSYPSELTLRLDTGLPDKFKGKVTSTRDGCVPRRSVTVYLDEESGSDTPVGDDKTNDAGRYSVTPDGGFASPGDFYAVVRKRSSGRSGHTHTCAKAKSPTISNGPS